MQLPKFGVMVCIQLTHQISSTLSAELVCVQHKIDLYVRYHYFLGHLFPLGSSEMFIWACIFHSYILIMPTCPAWLFILIYHALLSFSFLCSFSVMHLISFIYAFIFIHEFISFISNYITCLYQVFLIYSYQISFMYTFHQKSELLQEYKVYIRINIWSRHHISFKGHMTMTPETEMSNVTQHNGLETTTRS